MWSRSLLVLACFTATAFAQQVAINYKITTFDYPGAVSTTAQGVNNGNVIVGYYTDSGNLMHGYKLVGSTFTPINFPGSAQTVVLGINDPGDMVGWYSMPGENPGAHGYERHADGTFVTIKGPNGIDVGPTGINKSGTIVGSYTNNSNNTHGFILQNGTFTSFDAPEQPGEIPDTSLNGINNLGEFVGQVFSGDDWRSFWVTNGTSDVDFLEPLFATDNQLLGVNGHGDVVGCHNNGSPFFVANPEGGEPGENNESFPTQQPINGLSEGCANSINWARVLVGTTGSYGATHGYVGMPEITLTVNSPQNHATVTNPVHVSANATGMGASITQMQVWVNYKEVYHVSGGELNVSLTLAKGSNQRFVVQAVDSNGQTAKVVDTITVQ